MPVDAANTKPADTRSVKPLRPQLRGLIFKLALFYVLLSVPSLILVESGLLIFEFQEFMTGVERGSLQRATGNAADELGDWWSHAVDEQHLALTPWLESWVLRLQRKHGDLIEGDSYVLMELAADPLAAAIFAPDGRLLAAAPKGADWKPDLPDQTSENFHAILSAHHPVALAGSDSPYKIRRVATPIHAPDGALLGVLFVELRLPLPWRRFLLDLSLEWPIILGYLIVFGLASSFFLATWVTRRLNRVARAATEWSQGDFNHLIADRSRDELGLLSRQLDAMAMELQALMRSRAHLATLAERQRLARDLHDTVKQKAFALSLQLATMRRQLEGHPALERIGTAERLSQQIQQELAQMLDELRTSESDLPLADRLRTRARDWAATSGIALECNIADIPSLDPGHEEALLRIVDEALANILRHSEATLARVEVRLQGGRLTLVIEDNGRGMDDDAPAGMGLANMQARAQSLPDGQFRVSRPPDGGTRIRVELSTH